MVKLAAISPRTQTINIQQGEASPEKQQFEQLFSERAHATLGAKSPELSQSIVNFKILESDVDNDTASGIFIALIGHTEIHVPIVLAAGKVQSPEIFFSPVSKKFLPLTTNYLKFTQRNSQDTMGSPVPKKSIEGLGTPSLAGITSPPQSMGKFSSYELPLIAASTSDYSRVKVAKFLKRNKKVLKSIVKAYGRDFFQGLQTRTKLAEHKTDKPLYAVLTSDSPLELFDKFYGNRSKLAYMQSLREGYTAVDFRKNAAELVEDNISSSLKAIEPGETGIYKILKNNGKYLKCLIIVSPKNIGRSHTSRYLCILENGDYILSDKITAIQTSDSLDKESTLSTRIRNLNPKYKAGTATFVKVLDGRVVNGTIPEKLKNFTSSKGSPLTCQIADEGLTISFLDKSGGFNTPVRADKSDIAYIPKTYIPLYLKKQLSVDGFITQADALRRVLGEGMAKISTSKVKIIRSASGFSINGKFYGNKAKSLEKLASLGASVISSSRVLNSIDNYGVANNYNLIPRSSITKISSIFGPAPISAPAPTNVAFNAPLPPGMDPNMMMPPPGAMPPPGMDPNMMPPPGMDPNMMPPPGAMPVEHQQMLEVAADTGNNEVLDSALASVLISDSGMSELMTEYAPKLLSGLDSLCRIFLTMQLNFLTISEQIGPEEYTKFIKKLSKTIKSLGDIVIEIVEGKSISGGVDNASIAEY